MTDTVAGAEIRSFVERIERLEEEKASTQSDIKEVYDELKGRGYEPKAIKQLIKLRKKDPHERELEEAILDTYRAAIGLL